MVEEIYYIYLCFLLVGTVTGVVKYRIVDRASRLICLLLLLTLAAEISTTVLYKLGYSKYPVYHVFNVIEITVITLYFLNVSGLRQKAALSVASITCYIVLAACNTIFLQPIDTLNSNFITLESFLIIGMMLFSIYRIMIDDNVAEVTRYPHFWIVLSLLIYFTSTFFFWPCIRILYRQKSPYYNIIASSQVVINAAAYAMITTVLLLYPKPLKR